MDKYYLAYFESSLFKIKNAKIPVFSKNYIMKVQFRCFMEFYNKMKFESFFKLDS